MDAYGLDLGSAITDAFDDLTRAKVDYARDPVRWATSAAGMHLWSTQRDGDGIRSGQSAHGGPRLSQLWEILHGRDGRVLVD